MTKRDAKETAVATLLALLEIPAPPGGESSMVAALTDRLLELGIPSDAIVTDQAQEQSEIGGDTGNLIVRIRGNGQGRATLFTAHMDTVPLAVGAKPRFDREAGKIVNDAEGRALGGDNRTGCAVLLEIARSLQEANGDHPPAVLAFFVQEEIGLVGARGLDVSLLGDQLPVRSFNFDAFSPDQIVTRVTGTERFTISVEGIPSHAGDAPEKGVSAAVIASVAIAELSQAGWHGPIQRDNGCGSANLGELQGGVGSNILMPHLRILAEARSHDPDFRGQIIETWKEAFRRAALGTKNAAGDCGEVSFGVGPIYEAIAIADDAPVVQAARTAIESCGIEPRCIRNNGGFDANQVVAHGIPAVTLGVGQRAIHTTDEWIDVAQFQQACQIGIRLAAGGAEPC